MAGWWVGGYGPALDGVSTGIGALAGRADGSLEYRGPVIETPSPSWLVGDAGHVYSADEDRGTVSSFRRDGDGLVLDGTVDSGGRLPCQLTLMPGRLIVANYLTGTVGVIALTSVGAVESLANTVPAPTAGSRAHSSLVVDAATLLTADLGDDSVLIHTLAGTTVTSTERVGLPPGTGPRDLAQHPSGSLVLLGQSDCSLTVLEVTAGGVTVGASATLPGAQPGDDAAGIAFGPGGFVYAGLRGSNRIAVVRTDGRTVDPVGWVSCEGDWPRHLVVEGDVLHVACQRSSTVASFALGPDGTPTLIRTPESVPSPTFLLRSSVA